MKNRILPVYIIRALLISYSVLFIGLVFVRYQEYQKVQKLIGLLDESGHSSIQRRAILSDLLRNSDYIRVNMLTSLYYHDRVSSDSAVQKTKSAAKNIELALQKYHPFIIDLKEKEMFNEVFRLERDMAATRKTIVSALNHGELSSARLLDINELRPVYERFHRANIDLFQYIDQRDGSNILVLRDRIKKTGRFTSEMTLIILVLIGVLGIFIIMAVRTIIRKRALLKKSEKKYRMLVEQTHDIVAEIDLEGKLRFANAKLRMLLGYKVEDLQGIFLQELMEPDSALDAMSNLQKGPDVGFCANLTRVFINKSGDRIHLEGSLVWEFHNDKLSGATVFYKDVTERKRLEDELMESEKKFRQLFNMAPIPMYILDPDTYRFLQVNDAAVKQYGYKKDEFMRKTAMDIRPYSERDRAVRCIRSVVETRQSYVGNFRHLKKDGQLIDVELHESYFLLKNRSIVMVAAVNVTERKQNENRITQAIIKTQEDERYEIGSELHDNVCQILASARMNMGLIKESMTFINDEYFNSTIVSIDLATEEIRNLSHRLAPVFFKNSNLEDSFTRLLNTFNMGNRLRVSLYFDDALKRYSMSMQLQLNLYRILQEQLRNIIKYAKATEIHIEVLLYKNRLHLRIADNGIGFDKAVTPSGIGMANMKRRTEFFSGDIEVNTSPGDGCEVLVIIPLENVTEES